MQQSFAPQHALAQWDIRQIPPLVGKTAIVTGACTGLGFEVAKTLSARGAHVFLAVRNAEKGQRAWAQLRVKVPPGALTLLPLDLSDLDAVAEFALQFTQHSARLDILVNNAGVMEPPEGKTAQGFELQFGVNHLGHFALTARLMPLIARTPQARVVTVSSLAAYHATFGLDNLRSEQGYHKSSAYQRSKLFNVLFAVELERYFLQNNLPCTSLAAHPGYARTHLQRHVTGLLRKLHRTYTRWRYAQSAEAGALPILRAATDLGLPGGGFIGPAEATGAQQACELPAAACQAGPAAALWTISETLTAIPFNIPVQ